MFSSDLRLAENGSQERPRRRNDVSADANETTRPMHNEACGREGARLPRASQTARNPRQMAGTRGAWHHISRAVITGAETPKGRMPAMYRTAVQGSARLWLMFHKWGPTPLACAQLAWHCMSTNCGYPCLTLLVISALWSIRTTAGFWDNRRPHHARNEGSIKRTGLDRRRSAQPLRRKGETLRQCKA